MSKRIRYWVLKLHLWLGLPAGFVVFIVCITGCMYVFKDEIIDFSQPWRFVMTQEKPVYLPSQVLSVSNSVITDKRPTAITYGEPFDAVFVDYHDINKGQSTVFIDPYEGYINKIVHQEPSDFDFFRFVLQGHRHLWLPMDIGRPIVGYSVLLFAITLITGIGIWWPSRWNKKSFKRVFLFGKKQLLFNLHNVVGTYVFPLLLLICLTGMIWSLSWFGRTVYYITSGGKELQPYVLPHSVPMPVKQKADLLDELYLQLKKQEPEAKTFYFAMPVDSDDVIRVSIVHKRGSFYKTDNLFFDPYSLTSLQGQGPYAGKYTEASTADKVRRLNLEIHDGRIGGVYGKIIAFVVSLIGTSMPVTGIILWCRRRRRK